MLSMIFLTQILDISFGRDCCPFFEGAVDCGVTLWLGDFWLYDEKRCMD